MELENLGVKGMSLLEGEYLDLALSLRHGLGREPSPDQGVLLLTNKRVIHLTRDGRQRDVAFAALNDIQVVEVKNSPKTRSALIWGCLGVVVGILLYLVVQNQFGNAIFSAVVGVAASLMGVILIVDYFSSPERAVLVLQAGSAQLQARLHSRRVSRDAYTFINRLFQLKASSVDTGGESTSPGAEAPIPPQESPSPDEGWVPRPDSTGNERPGVDDGNPLQQP